MTILQALPDPWPDVIRYERAGLDAGELWRIITGNFVHLNWGHFGLNTAGLVFVMAIFAEDWSPFDWMAQLLISALAVGLGLHYLSLDIPWCVGLSGVLHGMFVYGAVGLAIRRISVAKWLIIGVSAKLLWEQLMGEMPMTGAISGGRVVTEAHLWGAIGGLIAIAAMTIWRRARPRV